MILVPDHDIALSGPHLAVLGADAVAGWNTSTVPIDDAKVATLYGHARKLLKWVHYELRSLTPLHLAFDRITAPKRDDAVAGVFEAQWTICSLLYIAEQSRWDSSTSTWLATFAADKYVAQLSLGSAAVTRAALKATGGVPWETAKTIGTLARWVYGEDRVADRLTVLQVVVANALEEKDAAVKGTELLRQADDIAKRVEAAWKAFIEQKLDQFFGQLKQLEETIEATSRAYHEQVQALTKTLIDSMLAAVAVVVGSFIAAMFKTPFQPYVFWFGAGVYLAYLLVFPILVGLSASWQRFSDSARMFGRRKEEYGTRLTPKQVDEIVGTTVSDRERWFKRWFGFTVFLYVVVVIVVLVATIYLPDSIRTWNDRFSVTEIAYGKESNGIVPVMIRGENFDKDKEIVIILGGAAYANTDGQALKSTARPCSRWRCRNEACAAWSLCGREGVRFGGSCLFLDDIPATSRGG